jgi:4a-hydroxytetrahydrobiopterin dehydratase
MNRLLQKHCIPCEKGSKPFGEKEINTYKGLLNLLWEIVEGKKISHTFKFKNFKEAMKFVNQVADIADSEGHHPDLHIYYNRVKVVLTTHAIGGLSENDFILASKIEQL